MEQKSLPRQRFNGITRPQLTKCFSQNTDAFIKTMTRWGHAMLFPDFFNDKLAVDLLIFMGNE
jgi:hypothetical protein